jgi:hypothetical protein
VTVAQKNGLWKALGIMATLGAILAGWVWAHQTNFKIHETGGMPRSEAEVRFKSLDNNLNELKVEQRAVNEKILFKLDVIEEKVN